MFASAFAPAVSRSLSAASPMLCSRMCVPSASNRSDNDTFSILVARSSMPPTSQPVAGQRTVAQPFLQRIRAMTNLSTLDPVLEVRLWRLAQFFGNPDGDSLFNWVSPISQIATQSLFGVFFDCACRFKLGLENDRHASGGRITTSGCQALSYRTFFCSALILSRQRDVSSAICPTTQN